MGLQPYILLSSLTPLVAILTGIVYNKRSLFWYYAITDFCFDIAIIVVKHVLILSHPKEVLAILSHLFFTAEFVFFLLAYRRRVFSTDRMFLAVFTGLLAGYIFYISILHSILTIDLDGPAMFFSVPYIILSLLGFYSITRQPTGQTLLLERSSFFWFNTAVLLYASGSVLLFLFYRHLVDTDQKIQFKELWTIIFITVNIIKNLLLVPVLYFYKTEEYECH